jgi:hypothetical protein
VDKVTSHVDYRIAGTVFGMPRSIGRSDGVDVAPARDNVDAVMRSASELALVRRSVNSMPVMPIAATIAAITMPISSR